MRFWQILLLTSFLPLAISGQGGYYSTDSSIDMGTLTINSGAKVNSKLCTIQKGDKILYFTPYQINEYGFSDGRVYLSKNITIEDSIHRVFLERLIDGPTTLYYFKSKGRKSFFLEKDSSLFVELSRQISNAVSFRDQLLEYTSDCTNIEDAAKVVSYNKKSLSEYVIRYNNCDHEPFPHMRYGLSIGYEMSKLSPSPENNVNGLISGFDYKYTGGFSFGLFIDKPILVSNFSILTELLYSKHGFSYATSVDLNDLDIVANISSLKVPIFIKYVYPSNIFRPYVKVGIMGSSDFKNDIRLFSTSYTSNIVEIDDVEIDWHREGVHYGLCVGGGVEYKISLKNSIFFELDYNNQNGITNSGTLNTKNFNIVTGIMF